MLSLMYTQPSFIVRLVAVKLLFYGLLPFFVNLTIYVELNTLEVFLLFPFFSEFENSAFGSDRIWLVKMR